MRGVKASRHEVIDAYERHLRLERSRSPHTIRAYLADLRDFLAHVDGEGDLTSTGHDGDEVNQHSDATDRAQTPLQDIRLADLRGWLGVLASAGAARSSVARRSASLRTFFGWATRQGHVDLDPSLRLMAPKRHRTLPPVLARGDAVGLLDVENDFTNRWLLQSR